MELKYKIALLILKLSHAIRWIAWKLAPELKRSHDIHVEMGKIGIAAFNRFQPREIRLDDVL